MRRNVGKMTMPIERTRAIRWAREFLVDLLFKDVTPRVPEEIRKRARSILKHYPFDMHIAEAAEKLPKVFGTEDLEKE